MRPNSTIFIRQYVLSSIQHECGICRKGHHSQTESVEELKRRVNDVSGLVERTDARGDRGNNGDSEGNDKLKKSYLVVVMYL